ncbi:MAG: hypothetical protein FJW30_24665 [Acidobacteria bacterium]|nr:hypothetical protein [Acidobacteriota bacterium]
MPRLLPLLLVSVSAFGQSVQILSDEGQVLVGRTMQFRAVVRNAAGQPVEGGAVTWATNNGTIATIDSDGLLTARFLGSVRVQARSGSLFSETVIQTIPSRVEIEPRTTTLDVGQQQRFSATAFDANGSPIQGVTFAWSVLNHRLGTSQVARVDALGNVVGSSEGGAMVLGTYTYGDVQPGMQRQWIVTAPVTVTVPKTYSMKRLWSRERSRKDAWELRAKPTMLWPSDDGRILFNAIFDGQANGLASLEPNRQTVEMVSTGGETRFAQGSYTTEYRTHSVTRAGKVLAWEDTNINGAQINLGDVRGVRNHISNNTPLASGTEATSALVLNRNSYNDKGYSAVRANFRFELNPVTYNGLFLGVDGRYNDVIVSTRERLPGDVAFTIDGDFGVDGKGTVFYGLTANGARAFYRQTAGSPRVRVVGPGDELLGSTVRAIAGGRGNHPTFWVDEDGTFITCVTLNNNETHFVRWLPDGKLENLRVSGQSGILWHHPLHGTLLHANPFNGQGNGVWIWPPSGPVRAYLRYGVTRLDGETVQDIESGAINTKGEIFVYARGERTMMLLTQLGLDEPRIVARSGERFSLRAPINVINFIGGARVGAAHVYAGGSSGSIVEFNQGDPFNILTYGERLFGNNTLWFGAFHGGTWNVRKAPDGQVWFSTGSGLARLTGDYVPELMVRFPLRAGTLTINAPTNFDINSRGEILFVSSTSAGDSRFFLLPSAASTEPKELLVYSGATTTATTLEANRIASGFDSFSLNDEGQVLASFRFRNVNVPVLYLHDGSRWNKLAEPNVTRVGPHLVTGVANLHRAGGPKNFAALTIQAGGNVLVEATGGTNLEIVVNNSSRMPSGQVANTVVTQEANRGGDLLFQHSNGGNNFLIVKRGETLHQVANLFRPTAEGDYLIRINSIDFRDDGTVYFLAMTTDDDLVLYQATPMF